VLDSIFYLREETEKKVLKEHKKRRAKAPSASVWKGDGIRLTSAKNRLKVSATEQVTERLLRSLRREKYKRLIGDIKKFTIDEGHAITPFFSRTRPVDDRANVLNT
jgi:hypothetical protein